MAIDLTIWSSDLDFIIDDLPAPVKCVVKINSHSYAGSKAQLSLETIYEENGADNQYMFTVYINRDSLIEADYPVQEKLIDIDGSNYRIMRLSLDSAEQLYRLDLGQEYVG